MKKTVRDPLIEILKKDFSSKQERNSSYSLRAFSRYLDIDASNLSKILKYQIIPGNKLREKISGKLGLNQFELSNLTESRIAQNINDSDYEDHQVDAFTVIADWQHYALLEQIKLARHKNEFDKKKMSVELGLPLSEINDSLKRLENLDMIKVCKNSGEITNKENSSSSILKHSTSQAHRYQQKQILEKAIDAMEDFPEDFRSQSSMTMAVSKEKLPEAREMIKDFRRKLARFLSEDDSLDEVYNLSVSLYPLTMSNK